MADRQAILSAGGGTARIASLFEKIQQSPISRIQVQLITQQHDYMKRIRRMVECHVMFSLQRVSLLYGDNVIGALF